MSAPLRLVLASNNAKKLKELGALFGTLPIELVTQGSLGVSEAEEPHITFIENALAKARHAAQATGLPAIADDSGLCVDALGGAPGVQSAVFAPVDADAALDREAQRRQQDLANNTLLLQRLHSATDRRAAFVCTLVAVRSATDPEPLIAFGRWGGEILAAPQGQGGFGYDPLMFIPAFGCTVAELPAETKNAHSHRALAAAQMVERLRGDWHLA
ncbi:non-canonical purine NTP pyrophosphatase [Ideonella dechloratans]|uniref:non-canonical purine NTP pyrophosphatase n=1 Tax=Ideonella dechloratans TaxID=36863 RepID=UPI001B874198|nr:non-canonical purine NTP pyrophosphatase [Ideonella dechloratans]UFU11425.1 non-canonical purine NTP pyrophosphatase [Ideonella dechloratans]